jgi:transcriptional regulator with XRE-family HTH domain
VPEDNSPHPNHLRAFRLKAFLTRVQLAGLTMTLKTENPDAYSSVSSRSLERLERGETRPRIKIAAVLAKALGIDPSELFPLGPDDGIRNPEGRTSISLRRSKRGPAKPK